MPGARWNKSQIDALVEQIVQLHKPLPEIDIPGKSRAAINNQRKRLHRAGVLNGSFTGRAVKPWTFPELKKLTDFTKEYGFSASFIAQMGLLPGRSKDSISKMMGRNGLGNPEIKERARQARRFDPARRAEFEEFVRNAGRLMPSIEIARRWGLAQKTVTAYRRRLGIRLSWSEARTGEEFQLRQRERAAAFVEHTRARWRQWRERKKQEWSRLKAELAAHPDAPRVRVCQSCGEEWYATSEFFHARSRQSKGKTTVSYCRVCRLCRAERRRGQLRRAAATA